MNLPPSWRQAAIPRNGVHDRVLPNGGRRFVHKRRNLDRRQLALDLEPRRPTPFPGIPNAKGLIEALADLLLEALGGRAMDATASEGGGHEPKNHG